MPLNIICGLSTGSIIHHNAFKITLKKHWKDSRPQINRSLSWVKQFNINLLGVEKCNYAHNFLLSLQRFSFIPTIDKPTRVHNNSATLIDNILLNRFDYIITSGNIVSNVSDPRHNSVLSSLLKNKCLTGKQKNVISQTFQKMTS